MLNKNLETGWRVVWFVAMWTLWLQRNNILFDNGTLDTTHIMELIQFKSWQ